MARDFCGAALSEKIIFTVQDDIRLDLFLRSHLMSAIRNCPEISNSKIRRLIAAGCVSVNSRVIARPAFVLRSGSKVTVLFDRQKFFYERQPDDISFVLTEKNVLFEDDNLIFVDKPAFFPVEQTITANRANLHDAVVDFLWARDKSLRNPPYAGMMHRLDRETSGVIVFTKSRAINKDLHAVFESHRLRKEYVALCAPENPQVRIPPAGTFFTVEKFMGRISGKSQAGKWGERSERDGGQYSRTDFLAGNVQKIGLSECVEIRCILHTGRTHQIRVHLSGEGLPILGDTLYGGKKSDRLYLHSQRLAFDCAGKSYDVTSPLPWL